MCATYPSHYLGQQHDALNAPLMPVGGSKQRMPVQYSHWLARMRTVRYEVALYFSGPRAAVQIVLAPEQSMYSISRRRVPRNVCRRL
jgi:hypothetical protein